MAGLLAGPWARTRPGRSGPAAPGGPRPGRRGRGRPRPARVAGRGPAPLGLAEHGYEPYDDQGVLRLRNCPFGRLAEAHRDLVCSANLAFLEGAAEASPPGGGRCSTPPRALLCRPRQLGAVSQTAW